MIKNPKEAINEILDNPQAESNRNVIFNSREIKTLSTFFSFNYLYFKKFYIIYRRC